ncbi:MAG: hypothetical protein IKX62_04085 [Bacteroidales bacterium]|nr:hypothetical protein [Bacteroidales bacterium]
MKRLSIILSLLVAVMLFSGCSILSSLLNGGGIKTYTFNSLPQNLSELKARPEANLKDPYGVAALTIAALCRYETSPEDCFEMLNWLKGPDPLSEYEKSFIKERLQGKTYKPRSYFSGATPNNNYQPSRPYKFTPVSNPYTFQNDGWAAIYVRSGGADNPRTIKLRKKASTGEWFLNEVQCLSDIRTPAEDDPWH